MSFAGNVAGGGTAGGDKSSRRSATFCLTGCADRRRRRRDSGWAGTPEIVTNLTVAHPTGGREGHGPLPASVANSSQLFLATGHSVRSDASVYGSQAMVFEIAALEQETNLYHAIAMDTLALPASVKEGMREEESRELVALVALLLRQPPRLSAGHCDSCHAHRVRDSRHAHQLRDIR